MTDHPQTATILEESQTLWGTDRQPAGCPHCQRVYLVQAGQIGETCPLCCQESLEPQPARMRKETPEKLLPFHIDHQKLAGIYEHFTSGVWIKPEDFTVALLLKRTQPIFWPLWLVDSDISGHWQMEAGFDYQVESTKEIYNNGQWHSRKQFEKRVRLEPRLGEVNTHVDNVPVPALEEHQNRTQMTGRYHPERAQAFDPNQLGKAFLEVPDLPPEDAWPLAKPEVDKTLAHICKIAAGAQHQRNFALKADYKNQHWTQFLQPLYATYYTDDEGHAQIVIVNGETGSIHGPRLASRKRGLQIAGIIAAAAGIVFLLTLISLLLTALLPPLGLLSVILGILGFTLGIAAIAPAVWPGQWNRKQEGPYMDNPGIGEK